METGGHELQVTDRARDSGQEPGGPAAGRIGVRG